MGKVKNKIIKKKKKKEEERNSGKRLRSHDGIKVY
jgi:hypothetical protein